MVLSTRLAAAVIGGLLLATVYTPAWAGSANDTTISRGSTFTGASTTTGTSSSVPGADRSLLGVLSPLFADAAPHEAQKRCKPDTLYSQHDVIGDPNACFLNRVNVPIL
jgi:hypothetical protein